MKLKFLWCLLCATIINGMAFGQETDPDLYCGTVGEGTQSKSVAYKSMTSDDTYGKFITANGTLRVLVVFVRFPDDDSTHYHWTNSNPSWFPSMTDDFIDQSVSQGSTNYTNITNYFDQMSFGNLKVIGDVVKITAPKPSTHPDYESVNEGRIKHLEPTKDVLNHIDTTTSINFSDYDNWDAKGDFSHDNNPDGIVDMIFMIWKGHWFGSWTGLAHIGARQASMTLDGTQIEFGYGSAGSGSGVTIHDNHNTQRLLNTTKHELGHWLLGGGHPYGVAENRIPSIMQNGQNQGLSATAPERERLGWITVPEITSTTTGLELDDFITSGEAYKYDVTPGNSSDDEFYYLTNHQKISIYDDATNNTSDTGLFILHDKNSTINTPSNRMLVSDGNYSWGENGTMNSPWDNDPSDGIDQLPVFYKDYPTQSGKNFTQLQYSPSLSEEWKIFAYEEDTDTTTAAFFQGLNFISTFNNELRSLFSQITNPATRNWSGNEVDFGLHVKNQIGDELVFDVDVANDPYTLNENTTWDGQIFLEENTEIDNNATLTILPGTTILLGENVTLQVKPGAKIVAEGTEQDPIRFMRADPDKEWNKIDLRSSAGNVFEWVLFDGGNKNVDIASKNNTLTHFTSRNGWRGISGWHNQDGSGNAEATISYALIEDNSTVGIVAEYLDLDMSYTTIEYNSQAGLYVNSATVTPFHHNQVIGNGNSSRDGIEILSSGSLYLHSDVLSEGYNEIYDNLDDQISNSGSLIAGSALQPGGYNSIHGNFSGGKYLIDNNSGSSVEAYNNWWGQSSTDPDMFDGFMSGTSNNLTSDPTTSEDPGAGGEVPAKVAPNASPEKTYDLLLTKLYEAETDQQIRNRFYHLYQLVGLFGDAELTDRFNKLAKEAADGTKNFYSSVSSNAVFRNMAKIGYTKSMIRDEQYNQANSYLTEMNADGMEGYDRRDYLHLKIILQTYHGHYEDAWQTLQTFYEFQKNNGADMEDVRGHYSVIEENLQELLNNTGKNGDFSEQEQQVISEKLTVQSYPNPFNPVTNIRYNLPSKAEVTLIIYDLLGREVATLVNEVQTSGDHTASFDASRLSSGIYVYRLTAGSQLLTGKMTLIK